MRGRRTDLWGRPKRRWGRRVLLLAVLAALGWWWLAPESPAPPDGAQEPLSTAPPSRENPVPKAVAGPEAAQEKPEPVPQRKKIVAVLPLSGPFAGQGRMLRHGMQLAVKEAPPDGIPKLEFLDGWGEDAAFCDKLGEMVQDPAVYALLVHLPVDRLEEVSSRAAQAGVLVVSVANTHQKLAQDGRVVPFLGSDEAEARETARLIGARYGKSTVTILEEESPYGTFFSSHFRDEAGKVGLSVHRLVLTPGALPPEDVLKSSKKIVLAGSPAWAADIVAALESAGYRGLYFVPHTFAADYARDLLVGVVDRVRFVLPMEWSPETASDTAFREAYRRAYWKEPGWLALVGYDCARWITDLVRRTTQSRREFSAKLLSGEPAAPSGTWVGGAFELDEGGNVRRTYSLAALKNGILTPIDQ